MLTLCRGPKTAAIILSMFLSQAEIWLLYGTIWFERSGSDQRRTLINRLFTSLCWTSMVALLMGWTDIGRYLVGPLPASFCSLQIWIKDSIKTAILLYINAITLSKYVFIFWMRNPTALDDDFWNLVSNLWIVLGSLVVNAVHALLPGPRTLAFHICCGSNPGQDLIMPKKREGAILLASVCFQVACNARITWTRNKEKLMKLIKRSSAVQPQSPKVKFNFEKQSLIKGSAVICSLMFTVAFFGLNTKVNGFNMEDINEYPNYLYVYALHILAFQLFGLFMLVILYARHEKMVSTLYNALKGN